MTPTEFSYFVDMTNRTHEEREYTVTVHFVDADGFSVFADRYAGDVLNKIPAKSTKRLLDRALINTEKCPHRRRHSVRGQRPTLSFAWKWGPCLV